MHVLGLKFIKLRQCSGHEFVAATQVEAHRVLGRCGGDDNLGVTGVASDQVQLAGQATTPIPTSRPSEKAPSAIPPAST